MYNVWIYMYVQNELLYLNKCYLGKGVMSENMLHTNVRYFLSELTLHTKMHYVRAYVTHENMMSCVCTNVTYENV